MFMTAEEWQATAEVLGVALVLMNVLGGLFIAKMQSRFVTRAEHHATSVRIDGLEDKVGEMDKALAATFKSSEAAQLYDKLNEVAKATAGILGKVDGMQQGISQMNHQLNMVIDNEMQGKRT